MSFMGTQEKYFDYSQRAQWLRAVVLGGMEGLVLTTTLMMGTEMVSQRRTGANENKAMLITGSVGLIVGSLRMAIVEIVSVYTQADTIAFQAKRDLEKGRGSRMWVVPSPTQVAVVSSLAYLFWGTVPLLATVFIRDQHARYSIAIIAASLSLVVVGTIAAALGKAPIPRSCARVLVGGLMAVSIMWGKFKILGYIFRLNV